ncbi:S9 family peptidase [Longimicrobium terrae]|uniref:Dipeptidyl-peptidase-4 n=1 Tax=Longimicrobium terrae TaxID=1639882 RepID=A0A841GW63_9BACT|nr:S9 family peptidase [Longimicrobium terrae]MBB4634880.1 dipeptidyl-peptidase-4 [Longimicrobium terrae]MBB6069275.1 dipeptidyl-peptidase-4 [Longimicrobium terrae]NNC31916.1 S9 family peptidase [Longimicrobium terrae]
MTNTFAPRRAVLGLALALAAAPHAGAAQQTTAAQDPSRLSIERIFASSDFRLQSLPAVQWMKDGQRFTFVGPDGDLMVENAATGQRSVLIAKSLLVPAGGQAIDIEDYSWSGNERRLLIYTNSQPVWRSNTKGQYYVWDLDAQRLTPASRAPGWQQFAKLSPDGTRVGFVRDNDIYVTDLASGAETRLTRDGSETIINGTFDWVYEEELGLQDGWRWSPDGRRIAYWRINQEPVRTFYMVQETDSLYSQPVGLRYPKAGAANPIARIGVADVATGQTRWMETGADSSVYLARMEWAASSDEVMIQRLNRHQNRLDVMLASAGTGAVRTLFTETDSAWVDVGEDFRWLNNGRQFLWSSERDGYNHLYVYNRDGSLARRLTRGDWEATGVLGVDERNGFVYFGGTEEGPEERQVYRTRLDGRGTVQQVSRDEGTHVAALSPAGTYWLDFYSRAGVPPVISLRRPDGAMVRTLADNAQARQALERLAVRKPEFFQFRTDDGVQLNGWMIKPADFDPSRKYPVLMYVYGGPGSQTVTDAWGGGRYLWHQMLAQQGYIVVSVDNRGTGARGRDFKKVTYENLGTNEAQDQISAARWLASQSYVDPARIGLWGWSYGGYMTSFTLMQPGSPFRAGVAVAPVADWGLYDSIYTERFMRTPQENPEGYRRSSPVANAANLRGRFLLIHGTGDDNVHFQNSVRLANALQGAGKQFQFMAYPNRTHSISGGRTSVHLYTMMTDWILQNL